MSHHGMGMKILTELYERDMGICQVCQRTAHILDCNVDHIIPVSKGGTDDMDNLQLTHAWCNNLKSDNTGKVKTNRYWHHVPTKRELKGAEHDALRKVAAYA